MRERVKRVLISYGKIEQEKNEMRRPHKIGQGQEKETMGYKQIGIPTFLK